MSSARSVDLQERIVHAGEAGASRHQAAQRLEVSLASASLWCGQLAREGHVASKPMGGDQRSHWIEAQAGSILSLCIAAATSFWLRAGLFPALSSP